MNVFVALLRAVNVGGTGKLPMSDLKAMCEAIGFSRVRTYIASGNVIFESALSESAIKTALEAKLEAYAGKPVGVIVRGLAEMTAVLAENPFPDAAPNRTVAIFLGAPPSPCFEEDVTGLKDEMLRSGMRELYVHYGEGMRDSRLKIPAAQAGTARNMNTVAAIAALMAEY
jgi:uncharacterized protein (DUF1697 family)